MAEYFVLNSEHAQSMDPQADYEKIEQATGLPRVDVRVGVLDLVGAGLLEKQAYIGGDSAIWPKSDLFVTFDKQFMEWDPEQDARDLAVRLLNLDADHVDCAEAASSVGWQARRFNPAIAYLVSARIVTSHAYWARASSGRPPSASATSCYASFAVCDGCANTRRRELLPDGEMPSAGIGASASRQ